MSGRMKLLKFYSSDDSSSISHWFTILNLFNEYKDELTVSDMRMLVAECEECREQFNELNMDKIEQQDTNPNVYEHLELLEKKQQKEHIKYNEESIETKFVTIA